MYIVELTRPNSAKECCRFTDTMEAYSGYAIAKAIAMLTGGYAQLVWDDGGGICPVIASSDDED